MSYLDWHVGMKVVCVKWRGSRLSIKRPSDANMPEIGRIYTIRRVIDCRDVIILLLNEISNAHLPFASEPGFNTSGFRPVQTRKTDISIFTRMLTPKRQRVDV